MTDRHENKLAEITKRLDEAGLIQATDTELIDMAAATWCEVEDLQADVTANGYSYRVMGKSGDTYSRHRPEHQMLVEARKRLQSILNDLGMTPKARKLVERAAPKLDEMSDLLNLKN
jgi:P27 family predicted phage terminase small subunit